MFGFFSRKRQEEQMHKAFAVLAFRNDLDRLLSNHKVSSFPEGSAHKLVLDVSAACNEIVKSVLIKSGKSLPSLKESEKFVTAIFQLIAADLLSQKADVSFELTYMAANAALFALDYGPEGAADLMKEAIDQHSKFMGSENFRKLVVTIGNHMNAYFECGELARLDPLINIFNWLVANAEASS